MKRVFKSANQPHETQHCALNAKKNLVIKSPQHAVDELAPAGLYDTFLVRQHSALLFL